MRSKMFVVLLVSVICGASARAVEPAPVVPEVRLTLDLSDGSRLVGVPMVKAVAIQTELGKLVLPKDGRLGLVCHQGMSGGRVVFDNLKIWNYAKTDFSDRNEE